jgi:hypothetical protein
MTWEHRKTTWLFLSLVIVAGALTDRRKKKVRVASSQPLADQLALNAPWNTTPSNENRTLPRD